MKMKSFSKLDFSIYLFCFLVGIIYLASTFHFIGSVKFDDAFMIARYAKNWLAGDGFAWNASDGPVFGVTSPLYLIIITSVLAITEWSDEIVLASTSWFIGVVAIITIAFLGKFILTEKKKFKPWLLIIGAFYIVFSYPFLFFSLSGMETTLALLCNTVFALTLVWFVRFPSFIKLFFCSFFGFLVCSTRPDYGIFAALLPPLFIIACDKKMWRFSLQYLGIFLIFVICGFLLARLLFLDFLPLPFFAKSSNFYVGYLREKYWNAMEYMLIFYKLVLPFILIIVLTVTKKSLSKLLAITAPLLITFIYYATVTQVMGMHARYYFPSISFVVLAALISSADFKKRDTSSKTKIYNLELRIFFVFIVFLPALSKPIIESAENFWEKHVIGDVVAVQPKTKFVTIKKELPDELLGWDLFIQVTNFFQKLPKNLTITASEHGYIGSQLPHITIIDLMGLHDRFIAHNGFSADYVFKRKPDLIWMATHNYTKINADIIDHPEFFKDYEFYPKAYKFGVALRKSSKHFPEIKKIFAEEFAKIYAQEKISDYLAKPILGN